jgi:hypothetical protein
VPGEHVEDGVLLLGQFHERALCFRELEDERRPQLERVRKHILESLHTVGAERRVVGLPVPKDRRDAVVEPRQVAVVENDLAWDIRAKPSHVHTRIGERDRMPDRDPVRSSPA